MNLKLLTEINDNSKSIYFLYSIVLLLSIGTSVTATALRFERSNFSSCSTSRI